MIKDTRSLVSGFFKLEPLYWRMATFGGVGVAMQFADRFSSRYVKFTGKRLDEPFYFAQSTLTRVAKSLFAIAFWRFVPRC